MLFLILFITKHMMMLSPNGKKAGERFIWDHIYVIATGHDGLERADLMEKFDKLPYKNKIMFTFGHWD